MVEGEVQRIEQLPEQLAKLQRQITWLELQNKKVDVIVPFHIHTSDPSIPYLSHHASSTG